MTKIINIFVVIALLFVAVIIFRTISFSAAPELPQTPFSLQLDEQRLVRNMSQAITFKTVSTGDAQTQDYQAFDEFIEWLPRRYPEVYQTMQVQRVGDYTLLFKWQGSDRARKPILLTAHYDVVPVVAGSESDWQHPPFAGVVADGYVWGRGSMDDKSGVIVMLEAASRLIKQGFTPERSIYLSFGHDEEVGGQQGAAAVVARLKSQGVQLEWSLDEGSFITQEMFPGLDKPLAMLNVAEKGSATFDLVASGPSGHSSMPENELPIDILAKALVNLRKAPLPGGIEGVSEEMINEIGRNGPFILRMMVANKWLFGPLIERQLSQSAASNAFLRTTTAPTVLRAGVKTNVIAPTATASVNFRLHPRDTPAGVAAHIVKAIDDDRVSVTAHGEGLSSLASSVSSTDSEGYALIAKVAKRVFGDILVVPGITIAGTDSKHYSKVADNAYRLQYMVVTAQDSSGFHGTNERVSIDNLRKGTTAYYLLMRDAAGPAK